MRALLVFSNLLLLAGAALNPASANSLQVTPVSLEISAPASAATITMNNPGDTPLKAQIRVMRWSMDNGREKLEPATDVVASPPMASLQPKTDYTVRIVRLSKEPVVREQTYRLIIDEVPDPNSRVPNTVTMAFRYSVPVFFYATAQGTPTLAWSTERRDGTVYLSAVNTGDRHVRIADLQIADPQGSTLTIAKGLAGYVLARSSKSWVALGKNQKMALDAPLVVTAQGDLGPIHAEARPAAVR